MNLDALSTFDPSSPGYATDFCNSLLGSMSELRVSDVHVQPSLEGLEIRVRLDGVLHFVGTFPAGETAQIVNRLKVMAELLTYRTDVPQEGRIRHSTGEIEMRVSTFPTLHGERVVIRMFASDQQLLHLEQLGFPEDLYHSLKQLVAETSGALIIAGPAGSGKTTTAYAILRELVRSTEGHRCIVSIEDPIEVAVSGVAQSQVNSASGFDLATGLRSLVRQDTEVMMVGEIRDPATAAAVYQSSLTGHLVVSTFHAGSAARSINRLSDMGIEPYLLRSGTLGILSQRLVRRLCECSVEISSPDELLGIEVETGRRPVGCDRCANTGYSDRLVLAELLVTSPSEIGRSILSRDDAAQLEQRAAQAGMTTLSQRAIEAVRSGSTSPTEIRRVMGLSFASGPNPPNERPGRSKAEGK